MTGAGMIILVCVHFLACLIIYRLLKRGVMRTPRSIIVIVLLVPVFGLLCLLGAESALRARTGGTRAETTGGGANPYNMIARDEDDGSQCVVPLEEALLINDVATRRSMILDILHREPLRYIDQLKTACLNSDMEVTHYATTTIMEIQRNFDLSLQRLDRSSRDTNINIDGNNDAVSLIESYIASGLMDGHSLCRMRERYNDALERKAGQQPDNRLIRLALVQNKIDMGDFAAAEAEIARMVKQWPTFEEAWLLGVRLAVERRDKARLDAWMTQMKQSSVRWSARGKDTLEFWQWAEMPGAAGVQREPVTAP